MVAQPHDIHSQRGSFATTAQRFTQITAPRQHPRKIGSPCGPSQAGRRGPAAPAAQLDGAACLPENQCQADNHPVRATLLIAKLDRLARNVAFIANLMDAGCDLVACDQPFASRLPLHILAAVAEDEARPISERTKAALQAAPSSRKPRRESPAGRLTWARAQVSRLLVAA